MIITGMFSSESEYIPFLEEVDVTMSNGNVDIWLSWVEERMIVAIKD